MLFKGSAKEISDLQSEVSGLMERINLQADVTAAVEKECEALRSTVTILTYPQPQIEQDCQITSYTENAERGLVMFLNVSDHATHSEIISFFTG